MGDIRSESGPILPLALAWACSTYSFAMKMAIRHSETLPGAQTVTL
jgi:hypothetical protein